MVLKLSFEHDVNLGVADIDSFDGANNHFFFDHLILYQVSFSHVVDWFDIRDQLN